MSNSISTLIIEYTGESSNLARARLLHQNLMEHLKDEVGSYTVVDKESKTVVVVKVTKSFNRFAKEIYSAWKDDRDEDFLGSIEIDIIKPNADGVLCSKFRPSTNWSYWTQYASHEPKGTIIIENMDTNTPCNHYTGVGRGLFQVAVEVSQLQGCAFKIAFESVKNSPGFYRKMLCESDDKNRNKAIDELNENVENDKTKPDTSRHTGTMFLKKTGAAYWKQTITQTPVLHTLKKETSL